MLCVHPRCGGMFLIVGLLSTFWSIALTIAMIVAIATVEIHHAIPKGLGPLDWLDYFLYLPQVSVDGGGSQDSGWLSCTNLPVVYGHSRCFMGGDISGRGRVPN